MEDPNLILQMLRLAIESAKRQQNADTDDPRYCVVDNHTVTDLIDAAQKLDALLMRGGRLPDDWDNNRQ